MQATDTRYRFRPAIEQRSGRTRPTAESCVLIQPARYPLTRKNKGDCGFLTRAMKTLWYIGVPFTVRIPLKCATGLLVSNRSTGPGGCIDRRLKSIERRSSAMVSGLGLSTEDDSCCLKIWNDSPVAGFIAVSKRALLSRCSTLSFFVSCPDSAKVLRLER